MKPRAKMQEQCNVSVINLKGNILETSVSHLWYFHEEITEDLTIKVETVLVNTLERF